MAESQRLLIERYFDADNRGEELDALVTPDYVHHSNAEVER